MSKTLRLFILSLFILSAFGCAQIKQTAKDIKPTAKLTDSRLVGINFEQADLVFDVLIDNPNPASFKIADVAYEIKLADQSLLSGVTAQGINIKEYSQSKVEVPVTLTFDDLKRLPGKLLEKDEIVYQLITTISVNLPVVGRYPIHLETRGELPIPRLPEITLKDIRIKKLSLTNAELVTRIDVQNPNAFALGLSNFSYKLAINKQSWGQGNISQKQQIPKKGSGTIEVPISLNILSVGQTAYQILMNKKPIDYELSGGLNLDTGIKLLNNFRMPLDIKGTASLN